MIRRTWATLSGFWETDRSLSVLLVLLVIGELVLPPLLPERPRPGPLGDVAFSLLLLAGMVAVWRENKWVFRTVVALGLFALPLRWADWARPDGAFAAWGLATTLFALVVLTLVVLAKVVRPGMITIYRLQGAVAVYLLFGLVWARAYEWVALAAPGAFSGTGVGAGARTQWIYFSLLTLTTVGYGDITPVHSGARALASAEALTGQLYLAILIARLVALELQSRRTG